MPDEFDLFGSRAARDQGMQQAAFRSGDYIIDGLALIAHLQHGMIVLGEDIRRMCLEAGIISHHHNAHGTLIKEAVKRGMLRKTGNWRQCRKVTNHARWCREYRVHSMM